MGSYQAEGMYIVQVRVRTEEGSFLWVHTILNCCAMT